jgi:hypothetical protein
MLSELGYGYTKEFRGVSILKRDDNKAEGLLTSIVWRTTTANS